MTPEAGSFGQHGGDVGRLFSFKPICGRPGQRQYRDVAPNDAVNCRSGAGGF